MAEASVEGFSTFPRKIKPISTKHITVKLQRERGNIKCNEKINSLPKKGH
jgi:hypothetical protein